jgi:tetratricopeptide (TPR) repeat protein
MNPLIDSLRAVVVRGLAHFVLACAVWGGSGWAQERGERSDGIVTGQPYQLTVCLRFSEDPLLTDLFQQSLARSVQDQLGNYFGSAAVIQVKLAKHWLLEALAGQRLSERALSPELLARNPSAEKVVLTEIDWRDGQYQIQWLTIDGSMQFVGALTTRATPDRQWVAKAVCLAVRDDFAPIADVEPQAGDAGKVKLRFHGPQDDTQLAAWLGETCILQPYWMVRQPNGSLVRVAIPHTVLRTSGSETTRAVVVSNLSNPWKRTARVVGFQALKLRTQQGRLRLHLVDQAGRPAVNCLVAANDRGFDRLTDADSLGDVDHRGYLSTSREFAHLAYVRLTHGGAQLNLPVPITGDVCSVQYKLQVTPQDGERTAWQRAMRYLVHDLQILTALLDERFGEVNRYNGEKRYEEALQRVHQAQAAMRPLAVAAFEDHAELAAKAPRVGQQGSTLLQWTSEQLDALRASERKLQQLAVDLQKAIDDVAAQARADVLIQLGGEAEKNGDYDEAIARYELALNERPDQPKLKQLVDKLKALRAIKDAEHGAARDFIYKEWENVELSRLAAVFPRAEKAFETLVRVGDYMAARKLSKINARHLSELSNLVDLITERGQESEQAELESYVNLIQRFADFQQQIGPFARGEGGAPAAPATPAASGSEKSGGNSGAGTTPSATPPKPGEEEEEPLKKPQSQAPGRA